MNKFHWLHPRVLRMWQERAGLIKAMRIHTGVYALVWTFLGFGFVRPTALSVEILSAITFALLTSSIMVFNDIVDAEADAQKPKCKTFAKDHAQEIGDFSALLALVTSVLLVWLATISLRLSVFCAVVWLAGLGYSLIQHWFVFNAFLVAMCSASPVLSGVVYHWQKASIPILSFFILVLTIVLSEIIKDMGDIDVDPGHKVTLPLDTARNQVKFTEVYTSTMGPIAWLLPKFIRDDWDRAFQPVDQRLMESMRDIGVPLMMCQYLALVTFGGYALWYMAPMALAGTILFWSLFTPTTRTDVAHRLIDVAIAGLTIAVILKLP